MSEGFKEQLSRVQEMASGSPTWDLSDNDTAALKSLLDSHALLQQALAIAKLLPFCDARDCAGGQHPAKNCFGCEQRWSDFKQALLNIERFMFDRGEESDARP